MPFAFGTLPFRALVEADIFTLGVKFLLDGIIVSPLSMCDWCVAAVSSVGNVQWTCVCIVSGELENVGHVE